jgi:ADP-L-glycero-D-manno-heptose 6-epimerase
MKKVIVTGGAGFIGSAFIWKLNREGVEDILIVDNLKDSSKWRNLVGVHYSDYLHKDIFIDKVLSGSLLFEPDAIVHMGACSSTTETDADYLMENNYRFSRILAQWAVSRKIRFIYASSAATYGNGEKGFFDKINLMTLRPINRYGYSKHFFDLYAERSGLLKNIAGIKFFNVFGPNEYHKGDMTSVVFKAFNQILETGTVKLFKSCRDEFADGEQKRDFIYIKDCIDVMWWLLNNSEINGLFNLGTGVARSWNELVRSLFTAMDLPVNIEYINMPENLRNSYQYFTQAVMERQKEAGRPVVFRSLEDSVFDYVVNHLKSSFPWLSLEDEAIK